MPARLVINTEEGVVLELRLSDQPVSLGRAVDNTVVAPDKRTSRHHAVIRRRDDGRYEVADAGSTYGTLLNGRPVTTEALGHLDLVVCGAVTAQFLQAPDEFEDTGVSGTEQTAQIQRQASEAGDLREQVHKLIAEDVELRRELGRTQEAERKTARLREEAEEEASRLREVVAELRGDVTDLRARVEVLGNELRNERSPRERVGVAEAAGLRQQLAEAQQRAERDRARAVTLEARESQLVQGEGQLKKEIERLKEMNDRRERREQELTLVVKPALERVHHLTTELEKTRLQLAQAQAELGDLQQRGGK